MLIPARVRSIAKRLLGRRDPEWDDPSDFETDPERYLVKYADHGDRGVRRDGREAIGGHWEEIGRLQFDFLVRRGLKPNHRMLDIGCGMLRGGRFFIEYLEAQKYTGMDISAEALREAGRLVAASGFADRQPRLLLNAHRHLTFDQFPGETFDVLLAQSVFTHLLDGHIEECFDCVRRVMSPASQFFFTAWIDESHERPTPFELRQPRVLYENLATKYGFMLEDFSHDYPHPRGQRMFRIMLTEGTAGR
jgi:SAM-dependent methyltransferase